MVDHQSAASRFQTGRTRVCVALMLGVLAMFGTSTPALALSGNSSNGNAAAAQYAPLSHAGSTARAGLPFTGYALIVVIGVALCLLSSGLVVRRFVSARRD